MTVSTHVYSAVVIGTPDKPLSVRGGSLTLDASSAPHVTGSLDIANPGAWVAQPHTYSAWATQRTNLATNPKAVSGGAAFGVVTSGTSSYVTDFPGDVTTALRHTATAAAVSRLVLIRLGTTMPVNTAIKVRLRVRASAAVTGASYVVRPTETSVTSQTTLTGGPATIPAGVSTIELDGMTPNVAATSTSSIVIVATTVVGVTVDVTAIQVEATAGALGVWFDPSAAAGELSRGTWLGTVNASQSAWQTRTITSYGGIVWTPAPATLTALDPRAGARVRVVAAGTYPAFSQTRTFDLGLRARTAGTSSGTLTLELSSDEAILSDWAPLAKDQAPLGYQASLRGLVNYTLNKVIPGAAVNAGLSAPDSAIPALADSQNLIRNPRLGTNATDWAATWSSGGLTATRATSGGPADAPTYYGIQATGGATVGGYIYLNNAVIPLQPGKQYVLSAYVRAQTTQVVSLDGIIYNTAGDIVGFTAAPTVTPAGPWVRISLTFIAPTNAAQLRPRVNMVGTMPFGSYADATGMRLSETTGDLAADALYFDGGTTDTAQYDYGWAQTAHASVSTRKRLVDAADPDALTWKPGQSALDFLAPLVQRAGLRLVCDESRTWTLRAAGYVAPGSLTITAGVNLIDGSDRISRDDDWWFDAAATVYTYVDGNGVTQERVDAYALTPTYQKMVKFEKKTAWPGPGFSAYAVSRAQGRGREVTASAVSDWRAAAEQPITIQLDGSPIQVGETTRVVYSLTDDRMTVTTRTTEVPAGVIDLLSGVIDSLTGTIDSL